MRAVHFLLAFGVTLTAAVPRAHAQSDVNDAPSDPPSAELKRMQPRQAPTSLRAGPASAPSRPQATGGLTVGVAGVGDDREVWDTTVFHLGAYADVLFGRTSNDDFGIGPYAELMSNAFDDFQFGGGATLLIPAIDSFPFALSVGPYGRIAGSESNLEPGIAGAVFWGSRSYNYHSDYVMSGGVYTQLRVGFGDAKETAIIIGVRLDALVLSLPFIMLINAIDGGSPDTESVAGHPPAIRFN